MMRRILLCLTVLVWCGVAAGADQEAVSKLVAPGAQAELLAGDFVFTEGPACDPQGNIFFTDIPSNRVLKWDVKQRQLTTFRPESQGSNGLFFDRQGNLIACEGGGRQISSTTPDGKTTTLVKSFDGKQLNSPNDLWIDPRGGVYFTDPRYGNEDDIQQDGFHVYYLAPKAEQAVRVIADLKKPNGVVGTADGKLLYVADPGDRKTYVYKIQEDGSLTDRKLIALSGSDGMTLDELGNLYLTADGILVYSPEGKQLGTIQLPQRPSNLCFRRQGQQNPLHHGTQRVLCAEDAG